MRSILPNPLESLANGKIDTTIVSGQLQPGDLLQPYEGQEVRVNLTLRSTDSPARSTPPTDSISEALEVLDVERKVVVRLPFPSEVLKNAVVVEGSPMRPCLIVPDKPFDDE